MSLDKKKKHYFLHFYITSTFQNSDACQKYKTFQFHKPSRDKGLRIEIKIFMEESEPIFLEKYEFEKCQTSKLAYSACHDQTQQLKTMTV